MLCSKFSFIITIALQILSRASFIETQEISDDSGWVNQIKNASSFPYPSDLLTYLPKLPIDNSSSLYECFEKAARIVSSARNGTMWALKMIDASSKIPSGVLLGNHLDLGIYDECIEIKDIDNGQEIRGRHCMYNVLVPMEGVNLTGTLSICLPSSCEAADVKILLDEALAMINDLVEIPVTITGARCSSLKSPDWTPGGIVTLVGLSVLTLFLVSCTAYDAFRRHSGTKIWRDDRLPWLCRFSLYSNAVRILDTRAGPQTLPALHGLRFFSMCWVIIGHEYLMTGLVVSVNPLKMLQWMRTWDAVYIIIGTFAVDTFFTISGFLVSYLFLKEMSTGRRFNIFAYYIHRYLRLTPALAALLLMMIFILPRLGSGAVWAYSMDTLANNCRYSWWPMMLYVHNYIDKDHLLCLPHTWYLAVEMHYFWISPFLLYPLAKKPKMGLLILSACLIASIVTPAVISYEKKYSEASFAGGDLQLAARTNANFYMESHIRAAPYLIGMIFGYLVFAQRGSPGKMTKRLGWIFAVAAFAFCFFSMRVFQAEGYVYNDIWETFYVVVSKPLWSGAVCWIIYASVLGFGGPIATFLSFSIYNPFSRISYCVYLVHLVIQIMRTSAVRVPRYFNDLNCFSEFLADFVLSVVVGFIFTLMFESPILTLEKMIKRDDRGKLSASRQELGHERSNHGIENPGMVKE